MPLRLTGLQSNMDTDSIIQELMKAQRTKVDKIKKKQTKAEWKVDIWKQLNEKVNAFHKQIAGEMRFTTAYNAKKSTISNPNVATVKADGSAIIGTHQLEVSELAQSGSLIGGEISAADGSKVTSKTKLSDLGYTGGDGSFTVKVGDKETTINVTGDTTVGSVVNALNKAGVNASFDENNQRMFINSKTSGKAADFSVSASNSGGLAAIQGLGINVNDPASTAEYTKWSGYEGYSYVSGYTGTDATQIAYNKVFEDAVAARTESLNSQKDKASDNLDGILKKYTTGYDPATGQAAAFADLTAQKPGLETTKAILDTDIQADKTRKEELQTIIDDGTADPADIASAKSELTTLNERLAANQTALKETTTKLNDIQKATDYQNEMSAADASLQPAQLESDVQASLQAKASAATQALGTTASAGAVKNTGTDAVIKFNNAVFTSSSNTFNISGMTIIAQEKTTGPVSITTSQDYDALFDTVKNMITKYNELVKEMDKLYNADSSKGYEPLTAEEKDAMTEDEVKKWEEKIKDSLLRRDSNLSDVSSTMREVMNSTFEINGKKYSLASFGIGTGDYFTTDKNERNLFHIDGDKEDSTVSNKTNKLMNALTSDPDTVMKFFTSLNDKMYKTLDQKMKRIPDIRTSSTIYYDKVMDKEINDYKKQVKDLEKKFTAMEDRYYKQFAAMETALAQLQSNTSALTGMLGG